MSPVPPAASRGPEEHPGDWVSAGQDDEVARSLGLPPVHHRARDPNAGEPLLDPPRVQVVRGVPDEDELAALVAGLVARAAAQVESGADGALRCTLGGWSDKARPLRLAPRPGPGSWRRSLHR